METDKILLVDGNALIHRSFHAIPPLTAPDGQIVNAVYGFFSILFSALKEIQPKYITVAFDESGPTFRDKIYKEYKAKRVKAPQTLYDQIPLIKDLLGKMEIPMIGIKGFEADDVLGTLCLLIRSQNLKLTNIILTGDKDTYQLIDDDTSVLTPRRGLSDPTLIGEHEFREKYGFAPENIVDFKALAGDPSDNIPGVKGIGEKTARTLISKYQSIENVYKNIDIIDKKHQEKLITGRENAIMSKQLATIKRDIDLNLNLEKSLLHDFDKQTIENAFLGLGFKSLIARIPNSHRKSQNHIQPTLL